MTSTRTNLGAVPHATSRARLDDLPRQCWCGQDLEFAQPGHCPRCGEARLADSRPAVMALAA